MFSGTVLNNPLTEIVLHTALNNATWFFQFRHSISSRNGCAILYTTSIYYLEDKTSKKNNSAKQTRRSYIPVGTAKIDPSIHKHFKYGILRPR